MDKNELFSLMDAKHLNYQVFEHPAVFTVEEALKFCAHVPGAHVKNLFLRDDKKRQYWLITLLENKRVNLSLLSQMLGAKRLSFGSAEDLIALLGVQPGSVTPLAILNDQQQRVKLMFDRDLLSEEKISIHPMENIATISVKLEDLLNFIKNNYQGNTIEFIDIPCVAP